MMLSNKTKRWLAGSAAVLAIGGGSGLALAQQGGTGATSPAAIVQAAPDLPEPGDTPDRSGAMDANEREDGLTAGASSVQAPNAPDDNERAEGAEAPGSEDEAEEESAASEAAEDKAERAESAKLASLAKIDRAQAEQAALAKVPGTATAAELGNENGNVVWEIDVKAKDGAQHEVKVDAGNGTVLMAEVDQED
jgi:uncharacterized membrane protein YkoI